MESVPILIRRYVALKNPPLALSVPRPIRVTRSKLVKAGELERAVQLAAYQADDAVVLVVMDADDDCPATLGRQLLARAQSVVHTRASVVLAKAEFEAWFMAAAESLRGVHGLRENLVPPVDAEAIRDAKGWLSEQMADQSNSYSPTVDQAALTSLFDFDLARRAAPSFDKLLRELDRIFDVFLESEKASI